MTIAKTFMLAFYLAMPITSALAVEQMIAKVVLMRGLVKAKLGNGTIQEVKIDQSLAEGTVLQTADKSFVKLLFIDKSQMNLGPNSQMIINTFPKKEPGIITLVRGQLRAQVTKNYLEMDDKTKSKLYIRTKTAAMAIRGTDFQVNYNAENQNTSLITFEGKVLMASIDKGALTNHLDQSSLEKVISSSTSVVVERGQISAVNLNVTERAMHPTKLGIKQFEALEVNVNGVKESKPDEESNNQYRNPLPPGAESSTFTNTSPEFEKEVMKFSKINLDVDNSNPNGYFNQNTGEYQLPAGSIIDLNTVNIIPPPMNAVFDSNSNTYLVPESFGKIDRVTGEYKAPEGLKLGVDGKFKLVNTDAYQKSQADDGEEKSDNKKEKKSKEKSKDDRAPASVEPDSVAVQLELPKLYDARPEMVNFTQRFAGLPIAQATMSIDNTALQSLATETIQQTDTVRQRDIDLAQVSPTTKVKIIFNAE